VKSSCGRWEFPPLSSRSSALLFLGDREMEGTELDSDVAGWKLYHKLLYFLIRTVM